MNPNEKNPYGLENATDVPAGEEDYSLEEILAEYGGSLEQTLLKGMEPPPPEDPPLTPDQLPPPPRPLPLVPETARPLAPPPPEGSAGRKEAHNGRPASPDTGKSPVNQVYTPPEESPADPEPPVSHPADREIPSAEDLLADREPPAAEEPPASQAIPAAEASSAAQEPPAVRIPPAAQPVPAPAEAGPLPQKPEVEMDGLDMALPKPPRPVTLEAMVESTVASVMEEAAAASSEAREPLLHRKPRRLFNRKEEADRIPPPPEPEPEPEPEPVGPEPELFQEAARCRTAFRNRRQLLPFAAVTALVPTALLVLERVGAAFPGWSGEPRRQTVVLLSCLAVTALLCRHVFLKAAQLLLRGRCCGELPLCLSALVSAADCVYSLMGDRRADAMPYAAVSCLGLAFALWGCERECEGMYDTFRAASLDDAPPYLVTDTPRGACKQRGSVPGFYTAAARDSGALLWQTAFLPLVLAATVVFAVLSSLGQGRGEDFLLNWSAILAAGSTFSLPLGWSLAYGNLAKHLQKAGAAVAGWVGAERVSRRRRMVVTDADLFPPGTVTVAGLKTFAEEDAVVFSHAASMARAAGSGLERIFDELLRTEVGHYERVVDFAFYEEGGWSGIIQGESILMGTASFMRKMDVRLPGDLNLKTGLYLSVDRTLIAAFALKYEASENVDFALRMMARSRVSPILASRDPNLVPELLRRKFYKGVKVDFPSLTERVALSEAERDRGLPRALIFREGLLPYAEVVVGSRRMCKAVRRATLFSLLGSAAGTLLAFYLVFLQQYALLTPLALEVFSLLWALPVLMTVDWARRY